MPVISSFRSTVTIAVVLLTVGCLSWRVSAQTASIRPDVSIAGVRLGDRGSAKLFLDGYQFRTDGGVPTYYFYNSRITTVFKLTGASFDDPYFITEMEVFNVGPEYQNRHFVLEKVGHFLTESGIHVGYRQSGRDLAFSLTVGIPGIVGDSVIGTKYVVKKIGEPTARLSDGDKDAFDYRIENFGVPNDKAEDPRSSFVYSAHYEFYKRKLNRFVIKISPVAIANSATRDSR